MTDEKHCLLLKRNKDLWVHKRKKHIYAQTARNQATPKRIAGPKVVEKRDRDLDRRNDPDLKRKKDKGKGKAQVADEQSSSHDDDEEPTAFINHDYAATIKDSTGNTIILDTGASSHMTPHQRMLENYHSFTQPRIIRAADRGSFEAYGSG